MRSLSLILVLVLAGCSASSTPAASGASATGAPRSPVRATAVADAVSGLDADISCAAPRPRADDYSWVCSGKHGRVTATIHLFAPSVQGNLFGVTLYAQEGPDEPEQQAADDVQQLTHELVRVAVPVEWRGPVSDWIDGHWPDGGRTRNVPHAGVTAAVQPLADTQWYVEVYELDGVTR